ncbi:hypothetical protein MMC11_007311 [Xylographa trunciseda]|nr:hypothetical protein [Xylographa trunciseda]
MDSPHLSTDEFFTRLAELFESRRKADHGCVFLTQKRRTSPILSYGTASTTSEQTPTADDIFADLHPASPLPVLIRATNGKPADETDEKIKLSTVVKPEALETFYTRYAEVWKAGMHGLRKRDRSARKKAKAKKRKGGGEGEKKA